MNTAPNHESSVWRFLFELYLAVCNGQQAVILFFVLSGFVLALSLQRSFSTRQHVARRFLVSRIFRLYPAAIATVLLFAAVFWSFGTALPGVTTHNYWPSDLLRNMLLVNTDINGVMWTLQLEVVATPLILGAVWLQQHGKTKALVTLALVLVGLSFTNQWEHALGPGRAPLGLLYSFIFGVLAYFNGQRLVTLLSAKTGSAAFLLSLFAFFSARPLLGIGSKWSALVIVTAASCLIALLSYGEKIRIACLLDGGLFHLCGKVSFSFYLLHPLMLMVIWNIPILISSLLQAGVPRVLLALVLALVTSAFILPLSWLSWRFVEIPGIRAGQRLTLTALSRRS